MRPRLILALLAYALLALLAALTLSDRRFQVLVWIVVGGLALKTWLGERMRE